MLSWRLCRKKIRTDIETEWSGPRRAWVEKTDHATRTILTFLIVLPKKLDIRIKEVMIVTRATRPVELCSQCLGVGRVPCWHFCNPSEKTCDNCKGSGYVSELSAQERLCSRSSDG